MKEKDRLNQLFDQARSEKPIVEQNQINNLVKSGKQVSVKKIKLGKTGRGLFNPQNLIIMISTLAIVTALLTIFSGNPEKANTNFQEQHIPESFFATPELSEREKPAEAKINKKKIGDKESLGLGILFISPNTQKVHDTVEKLNSDTLIIGEVLYLTQEELTRLGFLFNDDGFFYCNKHDGGYLNFYSDRDPESKVEGWSSIFGVGKQAINQKKDITEFSFYPASITGIAGEQLQNYSPRVESGSRYGKDYYDDLSVPVYFPGRWFVDDFTSDRIIWFHVTDEFFSQLPTDKVEKARARILLVKRLRKIPGNETKNLVDYELPGINQKRVNPIILSRNSMESLGLKVSINNVEYRFQFENSYVTMGLSIEGSNFKASANAVPQEMRFDQNYNTPMLGTTLINGEYSVAIAAMFYPEVTDTVDFFTNMHDISVPVRFIDDSLPAVVHKTIFWFYPTEEFFNCLPDSIGIPMAKEYNVNVAPKLQVFTKERLKEMIITGILSGDEDQKTKTLETVPCEYFPSFCEGLPGLDNINVYPNPATDIINVEVIISREKSLDYRIFDISGRLMIDDVETKKYPDAGMYKQEIDISSLTDGFYLLVLTDDEGAKMTRRVIKK